jgi:outer membrane receptor protein involved in Fe transport
MKQRIPGWPLLFCLAGAAAAQPSPVQRYGAVVGRVFDSARGAPVQYADVVIYSLPESAQVTGAITDKKGAFRLTGVKPGSYYVEVSFVGYGDKVVREVEVAGEKSVDIGRIDLQQKPLPVEGVEVTAQRPIVTYEVDRKVVDVSRLPNAATGTAVDALRNVPSVKVDIEDNVTVRGSANFKVLIDGRPSLLPPNDVLKQTRAVMIDKIEIITNPSAKYEPDGDAGIINLVLKKRRGRGASALVNASADPRGVGGSTLLSFRRGLASVYAGGSFLARRLDWNNRSDSRIFDAADTFSTADSGSGTSDRRLGDGRAGLDLTFGPRDKAGISGRLGGNNRFASGGSDVVEHYAPGDSSRHYRTDISTHSTRSFYFVTADFEHQFDTTGHKLAATAYVADNEAGYTSSRADLALSGSDTTGGRRTDRPGPVRRATFELGYTLPTGEKDRLEAGFQSRIEGTGQDLRIFEYDTTGRTWDLDIISSHPYASSQQIHSLYATYTWTWRRFGIQPGIRGEYGERVVEITDKDSAYRFHRWDYFPSLHASYDLGSGRQVMASYSRRIDRPEIAYLRPFAVWSDEHQADIGNPGLKPSYTNSWEAGGSLPLGTGYLSCEGYYRAKSDLFQWVPAKYAGDTTALFYTVQNVGRDYSTGIELSTSLMPRTWLSAYLTGDIYYYREEVVLAGQPASAQTLTWSNSANISVTTRTNTQFQLSGYFTGPSVSATGRTDGWLSTDLAVKQSFFRRALSVSLNLRNLLGPRVQRGESQGVGYSSHSSFRTDGLIVSLAVTYNFNNFRMDPKMRTGQGIESEGMGSSPAGQ